MAFKIESSLLDACALAILHRGDTYGYEITQEMKKSITVSESTLYPVLRRLQQEHLCQTYDQPYQGRNRRYYRITEKGKEQLRDYMQQWEDYRDAIQRLLNGPEDQAAKPEEGIVKSGERATESEGKAERHGAGSAKSEEGAAKSEEGAVKSEEKVAKSEEKEERHGARSAKSEEGTAKSEEGTAKPEEGAVKSEEKAEQSDSEKEKSNITKEKSIKADSGENDAEGGAADE